jgi:hypothetical protein
MKALNLILFVFVFNNTYSQVDTSYYKEAINALSNDSLFKNHIKSLMYRKEAKRFIFNDSIFKNNNGITNDISISTYKPLLLFLKKIDEKDFSFSDSLQGKFQGKFLWNSNIEKNIHKGLTFYFGNVQDNFLVIDVRYTLGLYHGIICTSSKRERILVVLKFNKMKKVDKIIVEKYNGTTFCRVVD